MAEILWTRDLLVDSAGALESWITRGLPEVRSGTRAEKRRLRHRPFSGPEVQRPLLKYVTFSGGPLDGQVHRIPREHDSIQSSDGSVTYRDSGEMLNGYPRFDHISE